ncbi:thiamine pyrophosphate-requiring protein [Aquabacterium sp. A7-Y]|uniref:thiamine pyrophosphate-requiring protein n=1 Tax=Aquabacterium sp. A7-Y TaxID=1349605 RepID=UPI00223C9FC7|nr:thiamine pyrophosphate-requiring protein [Aquabacterium sp. A7-Y]MCW7540497.1 thiamine pyrophosphate-requiring protein [Aquabacterium sp. A7-Y]
MGDTVSDFLLKRLHAWGVRRIFGYPGDGINGIVGALGRVQKQGLDLEFVQSRHEELSAFMACAHAKFTGEVGVCLATSGPGAIHLLNGLYDARLDHQPVLAIVGQQARSALGGDYQQEVDLVSLFKDVAHEFVQMATTPAQVRHLVDRAVRIAREQRTVTCIVLPSDLQELDAVPVPPRRHGTVHSGIDRPSGHVLPSPAELGRAADVLNAGEKVAMLVGAGALHATDEIVAVAETLGAGVAKALLGKAAVPDELPFVTGAIGLLGSGPSWHLMNECDTLLMVGSAFPYSEFLPEEGQARGVQIDIDGRMLNLRYPMEVGLIGDSRATLQALLPLLQRKTGRRWRERIEQQVERWWRVLEARAMAEAHPVNPQRVFWELSPRLPDHCIVCCDSGSATHWYARDLKLRRGMMASLSGGLATMGAALPYAIAAKLAHPGRHVIALLGDGAMQMNGLNALITLARLWRDWPDARLTVMVLNNRDLNLVSWEQRATAGVPRYEPSQALPDFPYAEYARLLGLEGVRVERPEDVGPAWDTALSAKLPTLLEMVTDPDVPPLPPHLTREQAKAYLSALWQRDPDGLATVKASARQWWASVFPGSKS